jgi:diaminopimelate decarboxylase
MTGEELRDAAKQAEAAGLRLDGLHFHLGSNFRDAEPLEHAIHIAVDVAEGLELHDPWHLCVGGGWGVAYCEAELPHPAIDSCVRRVAHEVAKRCRAQGLPLPVLHLEPGRTLVARAGVAVYRVGTIKRRKYRTWLLIDGGMADNPRPALYGSAYSCLPVQGLRREMDETVSIGGPFCETGDVVIDDILMPPIQEGELIAIPVSGAYQLSMAGNYNGACRPAVLWLEKGRARLIVRRETIDDLMQRDLPIA